jgi:hypothetical protein
MGTECHMGFSPASEKTPALETEEFVSDLSAAAIPAKKPPPPCPKPP